MTLYWPDSQADFSSVPPRLHAFIVGVGEYLHLPGGTGAPALTNFGLTQLTTSSLTAPYIAGWLMERYNNPGCPLGSIEFLASPGNVVTRPDKCEIPIEAATMDAIRLAFLRWWNRCNSNANNVALFYFAGHGISAASQFLLPADFADPKYPSPFENCIDFDALRVGMRGNGAQTLLFFVDACRESPVDAFLQLRPSGDSLGAGATIFSNVRASAAYYAAADGKKAYGPSDGVSFFSSAVIESLEGAGAINKGSWIVDTFGLGNALGHIMASLATEHRQPLTCTANCEGVAAPIHHPTSGRVRVAIGCQTERANSESEIHVYTPTQNFHSPPGASRPWSGSVSPPGDWNINVTFASYPAIQRVAFLMPPVFELEVPV